MTAVDIYDVQAMIRDARSEIRGEIDTAVSELRRVLREEIGYVAEDVASLGRTLAERTEHLA